jgi:hypothetical protein
MQISELSLIGAGAPLRVRGGRTVRGAIGTRLGNAPEWERMLGRSAVGRWTFAFEHSGAVAFREGKVSDVIVCVQYRAELPPWPMFESYSGVRPQ